MDVLYFAWVRERIGLPKERIETSATTVSELVDELRAREERYAMAFEDLTRCGLRWIRSSQSSMRLWRACARLRSFRR